MIHRITAVLTRLKTDWAAQLQPDAIMAVCQEAGYTFSVAGASRPPITASAASAPRASTASLRVARGLLARYERKLAVSSTLSIHAA
jgi:hypothetical protein